MILEGLSTYFVEAELRKILCRIRNLVESPSSRLWMDHATEAAFSLERSDVQSFFASMARLGEPFVLGLEDAESICTPEWTVVETRSAAQVLGEDDEVLSEYRFSLLRPAPDGRPCQLDGIR